MAHGKVPEKVAPPDPMMNLLVVSELPPALPELHAAAPSAMASGTSTRLDRTMCQGYETPTVIAEATSLTHPQGADSGRLLRSPPSFRAVMGLPWPGGWR